MDVSSDISAKGGDTLNPITILPTPGSAGGPALSGAKAAQPSGDGALFKAQLGTAALFAGKQSDAVTPSPGTTVSVDAELVRAVKAQLDKGAQLSDVVARLASSLAASVAAQLGISTAAAQQRLTQTFTTALQSLGTGPPQSNAERASSLVARFRQMAELATRVTNGDPGQPIRTIAGTSLDAIAAKANPAPQPDSILRDALNALAAPASPVPDATSLASAVPVAVAAASDGRTVALTTARDRDRRRHAARPHPRARNARRIEPDHRGGRARRQRDRRAPYHQRPGKRRSGTRPPPPPERPRPRSTRSSARSRASSRAPTGTARTAAGDAAPAVTAGTAAASRHVDSADPAGDAVRDPGRERRRTAVPAPPASSLPQPQHVDANAVVDQILRGMAIRTTDGQSEVRLRLDPASLGDVSVKLIVSGGTVNASLTAHTADAQSALAGGASQLAKTLADAGLKLTSFTVGLAGGGFADTRDQSRPNDAWTRPNARRLGGVEAVDGNASDDPSLLAAPSFGPPIYSARTLPAATTTSSNLRTRRTLCPPPDRPPVFRSTV